MLVSIMMSDSRDQKSSIITWAVLFELKRLNIVATKHDVWKLFGCGDRATNVPEIRRWVWCMILSAFAFVKEMRQAGPHLPRLYP